MRRALALAGLLLVGACSQRSEIRRSAQRGVRAFVDQYALPAVVSLEAGLVKEADLYRAAHLLLYRDLLGLPKDDPLIVRTRDYFLKTLHPDGSWVWSKECGCLQPKVLLGLLSAGVPPEDPRIQKAADWWVAWGLDRWGGSGWGECFSHELIEGRRNPLSLDSTCSPGVDLEYSMKAAMMLLRLNRAAEVRRLLALHPTLASWGVDLQKRFYDAEGVAWVLALATLARTLGVDLQSPELVSEAEALARQVLGSLDLYPPIRGCPLVQGDLLRNLVAYSGAVDPLAEAAALRLVKIQRDDGSWPFDAGFGFGDFPRPRGTLDGSATVAVSAALEQMLRTLRAGGGGAPEAPLSPRLSGALPQGLSPQERGHVVRFTLDLLPKQFDRLDRATDAQVDAAMRYHNDYSIHTAYYDTLEYLMFHDRFEPSAERDDLARRGLALLRRMAAGAAGSKSHGAGILPGFDTQCIGMKVLYALGAMGMKRGDPLVERNRARLLELRRDGGWLQLEYTFTIDPETGKPWEPEVEKTAKAIAALLEIGEDPREPLILEAQEALEEAVRDRRYRESHAMDWDVGVPWGMGIFKRLGTRDPEAFEILEDELVRMALDEKDPILQNPYLMGVVALGLEGLLPPDARPLEVAFDKMTAQYLPQEGRFGSRNLFYHPDFPRSARHSMKPLFAMEDLGEGARYLGFPAPPLPEAPPLEWTLVGKGASVRVAGVPAGTPAVLEWARDRFSVLGRAPMRAVANSALLEAALPDPRPEAVRALLTLPGASGPTVRWSSWMSLGPVRPAGSVPWSRIVVSLLALALLIGGGVYLARMLLKPR